MFFRYYIYSSLARGLTTLISNYLVDWDFDFKDLTELILVIRGTLGTSFIWFIPVFGSSVFLLATLRVVEDFANDNEGFITGCKRI